MIQSTADLSLQLHELHLQLISSNYGARAKARATATARSPPTSPHLCTLSPAVLQLSNDFQQQHLLLGDSKSGHYEPSMVTPNRANLGHSKSGPPNMVEVGLWEHAWCNWVSVQVCWNML